MNRNTLIVFACLLPSVVAADESKAPTTVKELWADFDPRKDPLDAKVVREWEKDGITYRSVTFHIGTFKGKSARMAAFVAVVKLDGGKDTQAVTLAPKDFKASDGEALSSWKNVDLLSFRAYYDRGEKLLGSKSWGRPAVGVQEAVVARQGPLTPADVDRLLQFSLHSPSVEAPRPTPFAQL